MMLNSNRRARELTESPLADVSAAYLGRGRFSNSPIMSMDSGFSSAHTSRDPSASPFPSPLPSRNLSSQNLRDLQLALSSSKISKDSTEETKSPALPVVKNGLPQMTLAHMLGSPKRRFSQVSTASVEEDDGVTNPIDDGRQAFGKPEDSYNAEDSNDLYTPRNLAESATTANTFKASFMAVHSKRPPLTTANKATGQTAYKPGFTSMRV